MRIIVSLTLIVLLKSFSINICTYSFIYVGLILEVVIYTKMTPPSHSHSMNPTSKGVV